MRRTGRNKRQKQIRLSPNYLDIVFTRDPDKHWETREDGMVVVDLEHTGFYAKIAQKVFKKPKVSHIALDRYGTTVWNALDGLRSVGDVISVMEDAYPDEKERMLDRTVAFLGTLQTNGFIRQQGKK